MTDDSKPEPPTGEQLAAMTAQALLLHAEKVRQLLDAAGAAPEAITQLLASAEQKAGEPGTPEE